jgi:hypothetical protein
MTVRHGSVEKFHDDELIVAIPQLSVVREELQDFGVEIGDRGIEENGVLGLARLSELKDIEKAVRKLERDRSVGQEIKAYRKLRHEAHPDAPPVSDLALLIYGVKLRLARRYPGWQIAIGKNYRPSLVRGNPHTDGEGRPTTTGAIDPEAGDRELGRGVRVGLVDTKLFPHESLTGHYVGRPADILSPAQPMFTEFEVNGSRPSDVPAGVTPSTTSYPAALPEVVGVGAIDADNKRAPFTPDPAPWISLLARGSDLNAAYLRGEVRLPDQSKTTRFDGIANWAGCSFAAGVVTGVIAARTEPGRRSARQALDELMGSLRYEPQPGLLIN